MEEKLDILDENGKFTGLVASKSQCHREGLWHKAVAVFLFDKSNEFILLQKRSNKKELYPNLWDTTGGHVTTREFGYQAVIRETKEELGIILNESDLRFIGTIISKYKNDNIINNQFNEFFVTHIDINLASISVLQKEEVAEIKWFKIEEILRKIRNSYKGMTPKYGCWDYLARYVELKHI